MKKLLTAFCLTAILASCANQENTEEENTEPMEMETTTEETPMATVEKDPTCGMTRDASWTEYTVSATGDSTWFCSETCKTAYLAKNEVKEEVEEATN